MLQLEKYRGAKTRHTCPACGGKREFTRWIDESGNYLAETVGKCNRDAKCGYSYTPKQYFADNPQASKKQPFLRRSTKTWIGGAKPFDFIEFNCLQNTLCDYERNPFVMFLLNLFPENQKGVWQTVRNYFVGTFEGKTVFWQIDQSRKIRTGKMMLYNVETGKRIAQTFMNRHGEMIEIKANWIHVRLKKQRKLKADFNLKQCYFGEHLLFVESEKAVAVVEAEKTAIICSIRFPELLWISTGGKQNLSAEGLKRLGNRKIILYPDSDGFVKWQEIAQYAAGCGVNVKLSSLIESRTGAKEKANGYDLADYLINEQNEITAVNAVR